MEALHIQPIILFSLLPVWVLVGLFQYLGRFTRKTHFKTWTAGWLFYALYLTLCAAPEGSIPPGLNAVSKNFCVATGALLMMWGSFQFINVPARQRLIASMIIFNLMWSCATADEVLGDTWIYFPAFAFLALASGFTAYCFFSRRTRHARRGAALLTLAFSLWSLFLLCSPFFRGSETVLYTGFMAASVLQLFIAISMMVLVLEETGGRLQVAVDNFAREVQRSSEARTEAENAKESYQSLFENSRDAVALVAEDELEILDLNLAARKLLAIKERHVGVSLLCYCSFPNQKATDAKGFLAALPRNPEVDLTLQDGSKLRARIRSQGVRQNGKRAFQIIFTDVAERSSLAGQIRKGGKLSALGQVISGVAHELNNPLAAIKGYTDLLLLTNQLDSQTRSALTKVALESNRAAKLVQNLLSFARPEPPRIEPIDLHVLIESFVAQRQSELEARDVNLELALESADQMVLASGEQLQQVLAHLLNNAVDALDEGEGERSILISSHSANGKIQIRVEDSGPGIDPDVLPRIFEPFFSTKPVGAGTGLGLSVCYSILLHHKGKISFQSSPLGGACFVIELPAAIPALRADPKITAPEFRPKPEMQRAARLLVVDDEPSVVSLLNDMLTLVGHQVTPRTSPYEALAELENHEFDAILSDFRMPGMSGGEFYERAAAIDGKYQDRFLFLTGDMMDPETSQFFTEKNVTCILKPFQLAALQSALETVLESASHPVAAASVA